MNSRTLQKIRAVLLAPLAALCLVAAAQAQTTRPMASSASMPMGKMQKGAGGPDAMKQSTMGGMSGADAMQKMTMSGDTDKDFAMMVKSHHQGALDMARVELDQGKSPEMKAMAKSIIAAQKKEIAQFDRWLAKQK